MARKKSGSSYVISHGTLLLTGNRVLIIPLHDCEGNQGKSSWVGVTLITMTPRRKYCTKKYKHIAIGSSLGVMSATHHSLQPPCSTFSRSNRMTSASRQPTLHRRWPSILQPQKRPGRGKRAQLSPTRPLRWDDALTACAWLMTLQICAGRTL